MALFKKKLDKTAQDKAEQQERPYHDFIPYYCHYNAHTLLTKNGELLQVIKIESNRLGLNYESGDGGSTVREVLRSALLDSIDADTFAISVHTLRKRRPIHTESHFQQAFAAYVQEGWQEVYRWRHQYYNEIYVTILHEGQSAALFDQQALKHVFSAARNRDYRNRYLQQANQALEALVHQVVEKIGAHYKARVLSIVERMPEDGSYPRGVYYSEPMEFLSTLVNLRERPVPVMNVEISKMISPEVLLVGYNAIETKDAEGNRRFGALLSLKQYRELPPETADRILQSPTELIISQNFNFIPSAKALKQYKDQQSLFEISGDEYSPEASGLMDVLQQDKKRDIDFGEQQTTIMVVVDEYRQLDEEIRRAQNAFAEIGLITVREDIKLEEGYWAMLPGNFEFIRRAEAIAAPRLAGLTRLNRYPDGASRNLHWNEPLALVSTIVGSPYFLNLHHQDNGHTLFCDFNSFQDAGGRMSLNLLITLAQKYNGCTYIFDRRHSSQLFVNKLEGHYYHCGHGAQLQGSHRLRLNPFRLAAGKRNQSFLLAWLLTLLPTELATPQTRETLAPLIDALYSGPESDRHLGGLLRLLGTHDAALAGHFSAYVGAGTHAGLFDSLHDNFATGEPLSALDMEWAASQPGLLLPLFAYLLHRVIDSLDGRPTLIVLHEALPLLENNFFAPRLESLLEMLKQNNVAVIATCSQPQQLEGTKTLACLMEQCATRIYVPDDISQDYTSEALGLTESDNRVLRRMHRNDGEVLLKQGRESIGLRLNLDHAQDVKAIYSNDIKNLIAAGGRFASIPKGNH